MLGVCRKGGFVSDRVVLESYERRLEYLSRKLLDDFPSGWYDLFNSAKTLLRLQILIESDYGSLTFDSIQSLNSCLI